MGLTRDYTDFDVAVPVPAGDVLAGELGVSPVDPQLAAFSYTPTVPSCRHPSRWSAVLLATVLVAGCSGGDDDASSTSTAPPSLPATTVEIDDGVLEIGAVLPDSGAAIDMGASMRAAIALGVQEINDAGGVNGRPITVLVENEGDTEGTAQAAVQNLERRGVDAIIGPTSSLHLLSTLASTVDAGVLTCAPTATALSLDDYPDDGLLLRTIPSDSLQASAIARTVDESGGTEAVVVYVDDAFGRPLAEHVERRLEEAGTDVTASFPFSSGQTPDRTKVGTIAALDPDVVVVLADAETGPALIDAIDDAAGGSTTYVVNDSIRRPAATAPPLGASVAARVMGVSPRAYPSSPDFLERLQSVDTETNGLFAVNAYDCLNLLALAAEVTSSSDPARMSAAIPALSSGGSSCASFAACQIVIENGLNPDYDGPDGFLTVDDDGQVVSARFDQFMFDEASGRDIGIGDITIGEA